MECASPGGHRAGDREGGQAWKVGLVGGHAWRDTGGQSSWVSSVALACAGGGGRKSSFGDVPLRHLAQTFGCERPDGTGLGWSLGVQGAGGEMVAERRGCSEPGGDAWEREGRLCRRTPGRPLEGGREEDTTARGPSTSQVQPGRSLKPELILGFSRRLPGAPSPHPSTRPADGPQPGVGIGCRPTHRPAAPPPARARPRPSGPPSRPGPPRGWGPPASPARPALPRGRGLRGLPAEKAATGGLALGSWSRSADPAKAEGPSRAAVSPETAATPC